DRDPDAAQRFRGGLRQDQVAGSSSLLPRHLRIADGLAVERLVIVHGDGDAEQPSLERERRLVMRHRAAAIAADVETGPRDQRVEAERGLERAGRLTVDQQRVVGDAGARALGRRLLAHEALDMYP